MPHDISAFSLSLSLIHSTGATGSKGMYHCASSPVKKGPATFIPFVPSSRSHRNACILADISFSFPSFCFTHHHLIQRERERERERDSGMEHITILPALPTRTSIHPSSSPLFAIPPRIAFCFLILPVLSCHWYFLFLLLTLTSSSIITTHVASSISFLTGSL